MSQIENIVLEFQSFATGCMHNYASAIKQKYAQKNVASEERLQVFNENLDSLKADLHIKMRALVDKVEEKTRLQKQLAEIYEAVVNDFYGKEF